MHDVEITERFLSFIAFVMANIMYLSNLLKQQYILTYSRIIYICNHIYKIETNINDFII